MSGQSSFRPRISRLIIAASVLATAVTWAACTKSTTSPVMVVAGNTTLTMNPTVTDAIVGTSFSFPGGAGTLDASVANQNLAIAFAGSGSALTTSATITSPTGGAVGTFTANVTFGSCIFAISASTFPAGSRLAVGNTITVSPCNLNVATAGAVANGVATSRSIALVLGAASSANASVTLSVNAGGQLTLNGQSVGTVTLTPISG